MEKSSFFNSVSGDRVYKAEDWASYFAPLVGNGVCPVPLSGLQVVSGSRMTVTIRAGKAWINGYFYYNTSDLSVTLATADGVLDRIDRIVLRWDLTARSITTKIKSSQTSSRPSAPALQRDAEIYELALADIYVSAGTISISQSAITDRRYNAELCGPSRPLAHAGAHHVGGSDPLTAANIGAAPDTHLEDSVASLKGSHGLRYYNDVLAYLSNNNWIEIPTGEGTAAPAPYYLSVTIQPSAWSSSGPPYIATMTRLSNVQIGDYMIAGIASTGGDVNDLAADCNAWNCVSVIMPSPAALYLQCYERKPDRPLSLILVGWHTANATGYCYLTGHASANSGGTGADGRTPELRLGKTAIEWRYVGDAAWQTLVPLSDITGPQGPAGQGIPTGGTAGQVLVKRSDLPYDTNWATPTGGGGGTPDAHASTHATGGSDPITPTAIGAAAASHNHTGTYAPLSHAASANTYGAGSGTNYGHVKLSAATNSTLGISGGTAATPSAVKAAYDLAAGKADEGHNHDDIYALIGHTHSGGSGGSVEYVTVTVPLAGWDAGVPCTQTISVAGVAATDYITAKYTSNAINTNERVADHAAYCCVTDGTPTPGGVLLTCWHERPTRDIRMVLRVEHGGTTGYMVMTGQARPSGGAKTANGSVIASGQTITVTELGFRPNMVSFVGSSGKTTITSGHGVDTGSTTAAWYADATGPGNVGTFEPTDDGFTLTVQGVDTKTLNIGWRAVGS